MSGSTVAPPGYHSLRTAAAVAELPRTQIQLTGDDRASFLHNLCTNNVRRLAPGEGCEAFLADAQGRIREFVYVFCRANSLLIDTIPGHGERLAGHLDRYLIRERVEIADRSSKWGELLVAGPTASATLQQVLGVTPAAVLLSHVDAEYGGGQLSLRTTDYAGAPTYFVSGASSALAKLQAELIAAGAELCSPEAMEAARIEAGTPLFGQDILEKTLPQELARDARAISFTKGCYLGQETVARIDALGHVNKTLVGVQFASDEIPAVGSLLRLDESGDGKEVGQVTSATFSPHLQTPLALAYVRRGHDTAGTKLHSDSGSAEVVALPVI